MGKGGGGKGGGGGHHAPQVSIPPELYATAGSESSLGYTAEQLMRGRGARRGNTGNYWINQALQYMRGEQGVIPQEQQYLSQYNQQQNQVFGQGEQLYGEAQDMYSQYRNMFGSGGLTSEQNAWIDTATQGGQTAVSSQLASMGLGNSTQGAMLRAELAQSGAGQKGQLQQENLRIQQAGEASALGLGEGALGQLEQIAQNRGVTNMQSMQEMYNQYYGLAEQNSSMQNQFFNQALGAYGQAQQGYEAVLQGFEYNAGLQMQEQQLQAQASQAAGEGAGSLISSLGSLLGTVGRAGGLSGIFGGMGGLVSGGGAGAGAAAGAGAGAAGGIGSLLGSAGGWIASVAGVLACEVAREVYGVKDPRWRQYRSWLLYHAPRWFRRFYVANARWIAETLRRYGLFKPVFRLLMDFAIRDSDRR